MLPLKGTLTLQEALQAVRNTHRSLAQQWEQLSSEQQQLVPFYSGLFGAADLLEDNYITVNGYPLYNTNTIFERRMLHAIGEALDLDLRL